MRCERRMKIESPVNVVDDDNDDDDDASVDADVDVFTKKLFSWSVEFFSELFFDKSF